MQTLNTQPIAQLAIAIVIAALLSIVTLILLYAGIPFFGPINDVINALSGLLIAAFVWQFHAAFQTRFPGLAILLLVIAWAGVAAIVVNSLLVASGRMGWMTGGMYTAIAYGLIGEWLLALQFSFGGQVLLPPGLVRLGVLTGIALLLGLAAGPLLASGVAFLKNPLAALSYLGAVAGWLLFPLWCWLLGQRLLTS